MTSREDVVAVQIQYRLSTLGFLAIPGTNITGNFGIGDQIVALDWVRKNIEAFGGDPDKVIMYGSCTYHRRELLTYKVVVGERALDLNQQDITSS